MEQRLLTAKERLKEIVELSCEIFQSKIVNGNIGTISNEASMQLQLGVILQNVGHLYEWAPEDRFEIIFEQNFQLSESTVKSSKGKARCDIYMEMKAKGERKPFRVGIELKCFFKSVNEATTDNRLAILKDIQNLEAYRKEKHIDYGCLYVYTNNENYANNNTSSTINIGEGAKLCGGQSSYANVPLTHEYLFYWDTYSPKDSKQNKHCFLCLPVE